MVQMCERFEKKLHDLELTRMISIQMGPQTRLLQNNDTLMVEKIQSSLVNTIPLWKSQMVLALGMEHSRQATAAQSAVTEMTNELLKKNADMLKMGTIDTAKEAERSIVDIETLQHTNEQLISTLDEVLNIQTERRRQAEGRRGGAGPHRGRAEAEAAWSCTTDPHGISGIKERYESFSEPRGRRGADGAGHRGQRGHRPGEKAGPQREALHQGGGELHLYL